MILFNPKDVSKIQEERKEETQGAGPVDQGLLDRIDSLEAENKEMKEILEVMLGGGQ